MPRAHYYVITGRLAEPELRRVLADLAPAAGFDYTLCVLPITVAALITPKWAARRIDVPPAATQVLLPGYCVGDLAPLEAVAGRPVIRGPKDLHELGDWLGLQSRRPAFGPSDIEIWARLKPVADRSVDDLLAEAQALEMAGADGVVLTAADKKKWSGVGACIDRLRKHALRVALECRNRGTIKAAVEAGVEWIAGVDRSNCRDAAGWGCEVVVVPDAPDSLSGVAETLAALQEAGGVARLNPGLSPLGFGWSGSLGRCLAARYQWPDVKMLLDLSTITETSGVDSAALNLMLLGWCQELGIDRVITAQDSNSTRSAVRECDLARRVVFVAARHRVIPRDAQRGLALLRDPKRYLRTPAELEQFQETLRDPSFRIVVGDGELHVISGDVHLRGADPYELFEQLLAQGRRAIDPQYAFYLGYEMSKALTALTLSKNYRQDDALDWGMLTVPELTRRERRALRMARQKAQRDDGENCS